LAATVAPQAAANSKCKAIHAVMTEHRVTVGCKPEHTSCFIGEVAGNHGMRGTTYFKSDGIGSRPTTSPDFLPYSGPFEYVLDNGTITTRETGVTNSTQGNAERRGDCLSEDRERYGRAGGNDRLFLRQRIQP